MLYLKNDKSYCGESYHIIWTREPDFIRSDDKAVVILVSMVLDYIVTKNVFLNIIWDTL